MELNTPDRQRLVVHRHNQPTGCGVDAQALRQVVARDDERVVPANLNVGRYASEEPTTVVVERARTTVHEFWGKNNGRTESLANGLVA
jgi:hypothetical protein